MAAVVYPTWHNKVAREDSSAKNRPQGRFFALFRHLSKNGVRSGPLETRVFTLRFYSGAG